MHDLPLISMIAAAFTAAWLLGLLTQWLRLSPIVGYLLAGVLIGPYTPGFVGDPHLAHQLAEVGVILLMFGVGLHFHLSDLIAVRKVALPGALVQSAVATLAGVLVFQWFGMSATTGAVLGMAMAVASTVVLMRVLMDANKLDSPAGHVAVGWLLVEDVLTVIVLVILPVLGTSAVVGEVATDAAVSGGANAIWQLLLALGKLVVMVVLILGVGAKVVPWVMAQVARLRSRELFTLTVLVFSIAVASGAYMVFGASMALGAFLAGMVVAQSSVSHQAAADALPLRDAFAVLFFVAVGMLFDPAFLMRQPLLMAAGLAIILIVKPLVALGIVMVLGHSVRIGLTVAIGLAQIGEFSFIVADLAGKVGLMSEEGRHLLVGSAIITIILNPMLFRNIERIEAALQRIPWLWRLLNARAERRARDANSAIAGIPVAAEGPARDLAVIVGYGPVGNSVDQHLREAGLNTLIIDTNLDTTIFLTNQGRRAIFGDARIGSILELAGIREATYLVLTTPQTESNLAILATAKALNPSLKTFVRARYLRERRDLEHFADTIAVFEEAEAAIELSRLILTSTGAGHESIERALRAIRTKLIVENVSNLSNRTVRDVMIPWTRVRRLFTSSSIDDIRRQVSQQHFSRWPVVDRATSQPTGYLLVKDLIGFSDDDSAWSSMVRPLTRLPAHLDIESALSLLQQAHATIGLVIERDSVVGLLTVEDILEQFIGRMESEYRHQAPVNLADLLLTDDALIDLHSASAEQTIRQLAAHIPADRLPPDTDVAELAIERERQLSTDIGSGIAIPHARCRKLSRPLVVFGRSPAGILFDAGSGQSVHLIFLLVTPAELPDVQLQILSRVATIAGNQALHGLLLAASSAEEIRRLISDACADVESTTPQRPGRQDSKG